MKNLLLWIPFIGMFAPVRDYKMPFNTGASMLAYIVYHALAVWLVLIWLVEKI